MTKQLNWKNKPIDVEEFAIWVQNWVNYFTGMRPGVNTEVSLLLDDGSISTPTIRAVVRMALIRESKKARLENGKWVAPDYFLIRRGTCDAWMSNIYKAEPLTDKYDTVTSMIEDAVDRVLSNVGVEELRVERMKPNRAMCYICNDIIESTHRHDFVSCQCGNIFLDGGLQPRGRRYGLRDAITTVEFLDWPEIEMLDS